MFPDKRGINSFKNCGLFKVIPSTKKKKLFNCSKANFKWKQNKHIAAMLETYIADHLKKGMYKFIIRDNLNIYNNSFWSQSFIIQSGS